MTSQVRFLKQQINKYPEACSRCKRAAVRTAVMDGIPIVVCLTCVHDDEWPEQQIYIKSQYRGHKFVDLRLDLITELQYSSPDWYTLVEEQVAKYRLTKL